MRIPAIAALILTLAAPAAADPLRELSTADDMRGFEAVGRVDFVLGDGFGFCTGTLVTPSTVLTAAHCLVDDDGTVVPLDGMRFRAGLRNGRADAERRVRRLVLHPEYRPGGPPQGNSVASDVALLELDRPLQSLSIRPIGVSGDLNPGDRVQVLSYARGRSEAPSLEEGCSVLQRDLRVIALDCQATFGASGAPVFVDGPAGPSIVSIISAGGTLGDRPATFAVTVESGLGALMYEFARAPAVASARKVARPGNRSGAGGTIRFLRPGE